MTLKEYLRSLKGRRVDVVGIGVSNQPLLELLAGSGATVTARDKKSREALGEVAGWLETQGIRLVLGEDYLEAIQADVVFRTPGLRPDHPGLRKAKEAGAEITSEMEVFFQLCPCPVVAVTGSDGKTTTATLIAEMLRTAGRRVWLGGNIGTPLLAQVDRMEVGDIAVLELSSFQLMTLEQSPPVAVITNLSPNHLDWHHGMEEYVAAKCNLFAHQGKKDLLVLNQDNEITCSLEKKAPGRVRMFSRKERLSGGLWLEEDTIMADGQTVMTRKDIRLPGLHNLENYLAACAAVWDLVPLEAIIQVARDFSGVEHRLELVREFDGVRWYNDSIGTSPTRTLAGLSCFDQKVILLAGGYDKQLPFDLLGAVIPEKVKTLILCGATAEKIEAAVLAAPDYQSSRPEILHAENMENLVKLAAGKAKQGDVVLFSPACASFDQYPNFMARGNHFKEIVNKLS